MSAYLKYFELEQSPFEDGARTRVVLGTPARRDALASIEAGLDEGSARICVSGGPGLGKTSLARALPKLLGEGARVAIVTDPSVSWESVRGSLAKQWGLHEGGLARSRLIAAARQRRLVIVIDQAERASEEFLDHLDVVLSYRSESDEQVIQSVLFAELSQAARSDESVPLIWWLDRIQTLQLEFAPLPRDGVSAYIHRHLKRAGWRGDHLFTQEAAWAIHGYSGGVPGDVSSLCERLLTEAAARGLRAITAEFVHSICDERAEEDAPWSLDDALEELMLEEAASDAQDGPCETREEADESAAPTGPLPTLTEALEHFEARPHDEEDDFTSGSADPIGSDRDASSASIERTLSAPPSLEALHAIPGRLSRRTLRRHGKAVAAAALIAALGGLTLAWLGEKGKSTDTPPATAAGQKSREIHPSDTRPGSSDQDDSLVLARIRGPVLPSTRDRGPDESATDTPDSGPEETDEAQIIDLRPASMIPDGEENAEAERFW